MPKAERILLQVRLSHADKQRIKSLAAKHGFTLEKAVVEAFTAWAEKLRTQSNANRRANASRPRPSFQSEPILAPSVSSSDWLKQALKLDWTKCPEVELLDDGENHLWMLRASDAPLNIVLRAIADGHSVTEIAEAFELELPRLAKVREFATPAYESNALN